MKPLAAWIVQHDLPEYPDKYVARLATTHPTVYRMVAGSLVELQAMPAVGASSVRTPAGRSARRGRNLVQQVGARRGDERTYLARGIDVEGEAPIDSYYIIAYLIVIIMKLW
jgi:hypothetical protein